MSGAIAMVDVADGVGEGGIGVKVGVLRGNRTTGGFGVKVEVFCDCGANGGFGVKVGVLMG